MSGLTSPLLARMFLIAVAIAIPLGVARGGEVTDASRDQAPGDVFEIDGRLAVAGLLTTPDSDKPTRLAHNSPMLRMLDGQIAQVDRRTMTMLRRFAADSASVGTAAAHVATLHLLGNDGQDELLQLLDDGGDLVWARRIDGSGLVTIPRRRLDALVKGWDRHETGGVSADLPAGQIVDLPKPYVEGSVRLDSRTIKARLDGADARYPSSGLTRDLEEELLWVRLPTGHDAQKPAGVMVWVSPTPVWRIPRQFNAVLDELGLIACGVDNAGNQRSVTERLQLMFDALENVRTRYAVDEKRVYVTGFSGGGRCSSMLLLGWPEVFAGGVPIVGLNSYHRLEATAPGMFIRAQVAHPKGRRLDLVKTRRFWTFTGETDTNRYEIEQRTDRLTFDGFTCKSTTVPGIGHDMPPADELHEAVRWVDEPRQSEIQSDADAAGEAMRAHDERFGPSEPESDEARASLVEITRKWPWTQTAWAAAVRLGYERAGD
ncbi:MAG: putative esterase [Phycisphaerales bacterium]|jgi:predicted esterase